MKIIKKLRLLGAVCLASASFNASATIVPVSIVDHGTYVTDTVTGWDWLDLTATVNMSYDFVTAAMVPGGQFDGWSYATRSELGTLWTAFGGDDNFYSGWSEENNGLFDVVASYEGDLGCIVHMCNEGERYSHWITADSTTTGERWTSSLFDYYRGPDYYSTSQDYANLQQESVSDDFDDDEWGSALYRVSAVPVPAAVWLFGSGLLGLVGMARRKKS